MPNFPRSYEREQTMQALYQVFLYLDNKDEFDATEIITNQYQVNSIDKVPPYSKVVYTLALDNLDEIIKLISKYLKNWTFDRLDNVAKAILVLAISEGNYGHLAPRKVVINQAIELAKKYLKDGDYRFINAVLDKGLTQYEYKSK